MGIRAKLVLPLLILVIVFIGSIKLYWLPELAARAKVQHVELQTSQLGVLEIKLVDARSTPDGN